MSSEPRTRDIDRLPSSSRAAHAARPPKLSGRAERKVDVPSALPVVLALAALLGAYAITSVTRGMWFWGVELGEFLPPGVAFVTASIWGLAAVAAMIESATSGAGPAVAEPQRRSRRLADSARKSAGSPALPILGAILVMAAAAGACALLPDRANFTGDLLLRKGLIAGGSDPRTIVPQAMPLDRELFVALPRLLVTRFGLEPYAAARLLGAFQAAALGLTGWLFARSLRLGPGMTLAVAAIATFQPALALFTGYAKPLGTLSLLTAAALALALSIARGRRGLLGLSLVVAAAILLHRSGLALIPLWLAGLALAWRDTRSRPLFSRLSFWLAALLPVIAFAAAVPHMITAFRTIDSQHLALVTGAGARGARWLDRLNVTLVVAPLAPLIVALLWTLPRGPARGREWLVIGAGLAPQLAMLALITPRQGLFRDWDVFASVGAALTILVAWLTAEVSRAPRRPALAAALASAAIATAVGWLALWNHASLAGTRIEAWLAGPPEPDPVGAASAWSFLAQNRASAAQWAGAEEAYAHATRLAPNPRTFAEWGMTEALKGDHERAIELYSRAAALDSNLTNAWLGLAASASWLDRVDDVRRAERQLRRLAPGHPRLGDIDSYLARASAAPVAGARGVTRATPSRLAARARRVPSVPLDLQQIGEPEPSPTSSSAGRGTSEPPDGAGPRLP